MACQGGSDTRPPLMEMDSKEGLCPCSMPAESHRSERAAAPETAGLKGVVATTGPTDLCSFVRPRAALTQSKTRLECGKTWKKSITKPLLYQLSYGGDFNSISDLQ